MGSLFRCLIVGVAMLSVIIATGTVVFMTGSEREGEKRVAYYMRSVELTARLELGYVSDVILLRNESSGDLEHLKAQSINRKVLAVPQDRKEDLYISEKSSKNFTVSLEDLHLASDREEGNEMEVNGSDLSDIGDQVKGHSLTFSESSASSTMYRGPIAPPTTAMALQDQRKEIDVVVTRIDDFIDQTRSPEHSPISLHEQEPFLGTTEQEPNTQYQTEPEPISLQEQSEEPISLQEQSEEPISLQEQSEEPISLHEQSEEPMSLPESKEPPEQLESHDLSPAQEPLPAEEPVSVTVQPLKAATQVDIDTLTARAGDFHFSLPCQRNVYKPVSEVMQSGWVKPLLRILSEFSKRSKQVTLVLANHAYQDILLNWLISATVVAKPPIENILVVALDHKLYALLQMREVPSILVPSSTVLNVKYKFVRYFEIIMMIRLAFMRLINRLGFDCAMYDIDAVILKNPQPLYEKHKTDIVGSRGELPRQLMRKWKVTICIGVVFIRSNSRTEKYWEAVTMSSPRRYDAINDQIRLNYGLDVLKISWNGSDYIQNQLSSAAFGKCRNGLSVTVLPFNTICRYGCHPKMRKVYYIWHKGGERNEDSKRAGAEKGHTWFLRSNWASISEGSTKLKGREWLRFISTSAAYS